MAAEKTPEFRPIRKELKLGADISLEDNYMQPYGIETGIKNQKSSRLDISSAEELEKVRFQNGIEVDEDGCPGPISTFEESTLPKELISILGKYNVYQPTPVQMQAIPILLSGRDLIAVAPTGSGKTFGYLLPLFTFLKQKCGIGYKNTGSPVALIISPTRELMQQIVNTCESIFSGLPNKTVGHNAKQEYKEHTSTSSSFHQGSTPSQTYEFSEGTVSGFYDRGKYSSHQGVDYISNKSTTVYNDGLYAGSYDLTFDRPANIFPTHSMQSIQLQVGHHQNMPLQHKQIEERFTVYGVCGGIPVSVQSARLKSDVNVIVGTPGRLIDLCQRNILNLENVNYLVLDECDKMLEMGLEEQVRKLIAMITLKEMPRQTSLWSATLPSSLERLARSSVINPVTLHVGVKDTVCKNIEQDIVFMHTYQKPKKLLQTLRKTKHPPVLVFVSTIPAVDEVVQLLTEEEFCVQGLHSQLEQTNRFQIVADFKNGELDVLVATDLASRGLDIPDVTHVINFDTPNTIEDYVHRCGRTGRFGRPGKATTFLTLECKIAEDLKLLLESTGVTVPIALEDTKQFGKKVLKTQFGDRVV